MALRFLADSYLDTARSAPAQYRFGGRKVFLAALVDGALTAEDTTQFEALRRAGLLRFARADYVAGMDTAMVAASQWEHSAGVSYHFVEID